jgi:predicted acylesterase/phospholipase RssA
MTYDTVVLSGGEVKGFSILGALDYLSTRAYLGGVSNWYGTSIGAIIGYLMAIGYSPREILSWLCSKGQLSEVVFSIRSAVEGNGATGFAFIQSILENMTLERRHKFYTLGSLKRELGQRLCVVSYNKTDCETTCFTPESHPDIPCLIALRMSANFPNLFPHFEYLGKTWVDGGVTNNFPIDYASSDVYTENIVGITVTTSPTPIPNYTSRDPYNIQLVPHLIREFYMYLCAVHNDLENFKIANLPPSSKVLRLNVTSPGLNGVNMNNRDRAAMFEDGFIKAREIFEPPSENENVTEWNPTDSDESVEDLTLREPPEDTERLETHEETSETE